MLATPTFAVAIGLLFATALAYGTTQTHLVFSGGGTGACASASCTSAGPGQSPLHSGSGGRNGSAQGSGAAGAGTGSGGQTATTQGSVTTRRGTQSPANSSPSAGDRSPGHQVGASQPAIAYRLVKSWHGGFQAAITVTNHGKAPITGWQLWLRYQTSQISRVWRARWYPANRRVPSSGLVAPASGQQTLRPGGSYHFVFQASGKSGTPDGCLFNGYHCSIGR